MHFTISPEKAPAIRTCLDALSGVGISLAGSALTVEVFEPFGSERQDKVRAVIASIDPTAVES